jgi:DHA3 family tetracycline resistance protein-like MFS transporter
MLTMLLRGPRRSADPTRTYYCLQGSWSLFHSLAFALTLLYQVQVVA